MAFLSTPLHLVLEGLGRMSVQYFSTKARHSAFGPVGPTRLHPIGTGVAEGQIEYCSAPLTRTTNSSPSIVKPPDISLAASIALHLITSCRIDSPRYRSTACSTFVTPLIVHIGAAAVLDFSGDNPDQVLELRTAKQVVARHAATDWFSLRARRILRPRVHRGESVFRGACALDKRMLI
jgi:hypothetical protein